MVEELTERDFLVDSGHDIHSSSDVSEPQGRRGPVGDLLIRFNQLITLPLVDMIEHGRADQAWRDSAPTFHSKILGPHFENRAREWTRAFAPA